MTTERDAAEEMREEIERLDRSDILWRENAQAYEYAKEAEIRDNDILRQKIKRWLRALESARKGEQPQ